MKRYSYGLFIFVFVALVGVITQHVSHYARMRPVVTNSSYKVVCIPTENIHAENDHQLLPEAHINHVTEYQGKSYTCYFSFKKSPPLCQATNEGNKFKNNYIYPSLVEGETCFFADDTHKTVLKMLESRAKIDDFGGIIVNDVQEARELLKD